MLTAFEDGILGQCVALVSWSVSLLHLRVIFHCKTLMYRNLNQNYNILYLKHLIYNLYVYTCVFLLHQKSFNIILINNPSFSDGDVTPLVCQTILTTYYLTERGGLKRTDRALTTYRLYLQPMG
jgi:hypothetical protein